MFRLFAGLLVLFVSCTQQKPATENHIVVIEGMKFQPSALLVRSGDTVTWINRDIVDHDITEENTKAWSSGILGAGEQWSRVTTSSASYFCSIHMVMKGKLKVN